MTKVAIFSASADRQDDLIAKVKSGGYEPTTGSGDILLVDALTDEAAALERARSVKDGEGAPVVMVMGASQQLNPELMECVDDFVIEPFSAGELWLRLKRLTAADGETKTIHIDGLVIHPDTYEALLDGTPLNLTYKEYELLKFLASRPGRVWDRQTLLNKIWEYDYFGGTRTVDVHIRRLRSKLGRYADLIQTVRQVGYKFSKNF
ncbi:MAG: response regulator transcription factor [Actinomycetota bacterium]|nr:response regulator transcription factor [Actinomycetota bacterium]